CSETKAKLTVWMAGAKIRVRRRLQMAEPQGMQWLDQGDPRIYFGKAIEVVARQREMQGITDNVETAGLGSGNEYLQFVGGHSITPHRRLQFDEDAAPPRRQHLDVVHRTDGQNRRDV